MKADSDDWVGPPHPTLSSSESHPCGHSFDFDRIRSQVGANQLHLEASHLLPHGFWAPRSSAYELSFYVIINPLLKCADPQRLNVLCRFQLGLQRCRSLSGHIKPGQPWKFHAELLFPTHLAGSRGSPVARFHRPFHSYLSHARCKLPTHCCGALQAHGRYSQYLSVYMLLSIGYINTCH